MSDAAAIDSPPTTPPATPPRAFADRSDRWVFVAALLLSLATLATAWSGYQAARWGGIVVQENRAATAARTDAIRKSSMADRQLMIDVVAFAEWLNAELAGDEPRAEAVRDRFRPEFVPAFDSWYAGRDGADLPDGTPFDGGYELKVQATLDGLLADADEHAALADRAAQTTDNYILVGVLYASVLFFAGIGSKLRRAAAEHLVIVLSGLAFVVATTVMLLLPASLEF